MDRTEALQLLKGAPSHRRLTAARFLARTAKTGDLPTLRKLVREEPVSFVKRALAQAIARIESGRNEEARNHSSDDGPIDSERAAYTRAVEWVTNSLLHEISPRLGAIRVEARRALPAYDESSLKRRIDSLAAVLSGLEELRKAAVSEAMIETNLHSIISEIATLETKSRPSEVAIQGPKDLVAIVDPNLLHIAVSNAIRNAIEATAATGWNSPVVVSFGSTDLDYWITVLDSGPGLTGPSDAAFEFGRTTKTGHRGFGLAIARQAMMTLDGNIILQPAHNGGARLEMRWFK